MKTNEPTLLSALSIVMILATLACAIPGVESVSGSDATLVAMSVDLTVAAARLATAEAGGQSSGDAGDSNSADSGNQQENVIASDTPAPADTQAAPATNPPPATATTSAAMLTAGQSLSCVDGPEWQLYNWVTSLPNGEQVKILGKVENPNSTYYHIEKQDGVQCWIFGDSSDITGNHSDIPVIVDIPPLPEVSVRVDNQSDSLVCHIALDNVYTGETIYKKIADPWMLPHENASIKVPAGYYHIELQNCYAIVLSVQKDIVVGPSDPPTITLSSPSIPKACNGVADYGPLKVGSWVILQEHDVVNGGANWNPAMDAFVSFGAQITNLSGLDPEGCTIVSVDVDAGLYFWRVRNMIIDDVN